MGKRSDFERMKGDFYVTPYSAVVPLIPHIRNIRTFDEPCAGDGTLINHLTAHGLRCGRAMEIDRERIPKSGFMIEQGDALQLQNCLSQCFITNPSWTRSILHPLIIHLSNIAPTFLLFDADWAYTGQARPYLERCVKIVTVGRVKWIADSKYYGKDNAAWYLFTAAHQDGPRFFPSLAKEA
jgi:hypothetical protein